MRLVIVLFILLTASCAYSEEWVATAYCSCQKCCGKSDGITASGIKAHIGTCACNWLKFGTKLSVQGLGVLTVEDRGSTRHFGSLSHKIKRIDVWFPSHKEALEFGKRKVNVEIL